MVRLCSVMRENQSMLNTHCFTASTLVIIKSFQFYKGIRFETESWLILGLIYVT